MRSLADWIIRAPKQVAEQHYPLVLVVASGRRGRPSALQGVSKRTGAPGTNVNLELSRLALDLTGRGRAPRLLGKIAGEATGELVSLDNIETLFDTDLKQDPLCLLHGISRNITMVAAWPGQIVDPHGDHDTSATKDMRRTTRGRCLRASRSWAEAGLVCTHES